MTCRSYQGSHFEVIFFASLKIIVTVFRTQDAGTCFVATGCLRRRETNCKTFRFHCAVLCVYIQCYLTHICRLKLFFWTFLCNLCWIFSSKFGAYMTYCTKHVLDIFIQMYHRLKHNSVYQHIGTIINISSWIRLHVAAANGPSSGRYRTYYRFHKVYTEWDLISFTVKIKCSPSQELIFIIVSLCWYIELRFRRWYICLKLLLHNGMASVKKKYIYIYMCVCVCVCERERERDYSQKCPNVVILPMSVFVTSYAIFTPCCLWLCFQGCSFLSPSDTYLGPSLTPTGRDCSFLKHALYLNNVSIFRYCFIENNLFVLETRVVSECSLGK